MELKLSQSCCLPTNVKPIIFKSSPFFPKNSTLFAQRCKLHIQQISWKTQDVTKKILVHVVKEGETLTSISKLYGVPIVDIAAANKDIVDIDLVLEGQHLDVPSPITKYTQVFHVEWHLLCIFSSQRHFNGGKWIRDKVSKTTQDLGFHGRKWNQMFMEPSPHPLLLAKTTGSFLVLVPLIAFCIRCIMAAFKSIIVRGLRHQEVQKLGVHHCGSKSMRWRSALSDLRDPDTMEAEFEPDSDHFSEDRDQMHTDDLSRAYTKLEDDYQKFLSECGMSKWGYWRGGSPK